MNPQALTPYDAMPIGAVLHYAADTTIFQNIMALAQAGWMPCDGSAVDVSMYPDLYAVIGTTNGGHVIHGAVVRFFLPDMRGLFARGVDHGAGRDPEAGARTANAEGGSTGDACGSFQGFATAAPHNPFVSDSQGQHDHTLANITTSDHYAYGGGGDDKAHTNDGGTILTESAGAHTHNIIPGGGDAETRPANLCLNWIIRFQAAQQTTTKEGTTHVR